MIPNISAELKKWNENWEKMQSRLDEIVRLLRELEFHARAK